MRKIIICMDGTGNEVGDKETNVLKLYKALKKDDVQVCHYVPGVGTMDNQRMFGKAVQRVKAIMGLAFGLGLEDDVLDAYRFLATTYKSAEVHAAEAGSKPSDSFQDDRIYIFGFSRGAYAARVLAGFIHNFGLVSPDRLHMITQVFRAYRRVTNAEKGEDPDKVFQKLREYEHVMDPDRVVPIRFLGLYDTVSSMIRLPILRGDLRTIYREGSLLEYGTHANVNQNCSVRIVRHALAADERRSMFRPQVWQPGPYYGNRFKRGTEKTQFVEQRWFAGYHSDIGGSPPEDESGIGKITLLWMLDELKAAEEAADAEDAAIRKSERKRALPLAARFAPGLELKRGAMKNYLTGENGKKTPGGLPYCGPDPMAPIHNSIWGTDWKPKGSWIWALFEFLPKCITRRTWPPGPFLLRRGIIWFLPMFEPRVIPKDHILDPSLLTRRDKDPDYDPPNLRARLEQSG
ncbi:DUF2235 domain-containing protein [Loktanella sp. IMCC34160]|uniref:T6SS phospholipase effector Tle1-like catalytic domain-containing protein n=1 Tax=Loktanella sp. IMCC34160 TaxID=2510646 RepID=UPI00101C602C|nr:DUF2235 domain-containing protein [Loktanella sp. IMCC34160]RYG92237.1 DUF2235 domain-containing protein [Loktanella sp. IMCC34160]